MECDEDFEQIEFLKFVFFRYRKLAKYQYLNLLLNSVCFKANLSFENITK